MVRGKRRRRRGPNTVLDDLGRADNMAAEEPGLTTQQVRHLLQQSERCVEQHQSRLYTQGFRFPKRRCGVCEEACTRHHSPNPHVTNSKMKPDCLSSALAVSVSVSGCFVLRTGGGQQVE